jgi:hypothetical protein
MACQAVFDRRGMFPHKRTSDICVTLKAFQVDILGIDQLVRDGSMGVVAVGTLHLAFPNRMMGLP